MEMTSSLCEIRLDGRTDSSLDWSKEIDQALSAAAEGKSLFWRLDLGLFQSLKAPLEDQLQFRSLSLAVDQFYEKIWTQFQQNSQAVSIYCGSGRFDQVFEWDDSLTLEYEGWKRELKGIELSDVEGKQIFAAHRAFDFFELLSNRAPYDLDFTVEIDAAKIGSIFLLGQTVASEISQHIQVVLKNGLVELVPDSPIGLVLPEIEYATKEGRELWEEAAVALVEREGSFRILSEAFIINKWEGLDFLFVDPQTLSPSGSRKLQGFTAAGGEVKDLSECLLALN